MKPFTSYISLLCLCALVAACGNPNERLDEYVFYAGPAFKLKVVRYYRNIPFNYLGEQAVVMCQSKNTADFSGHDSQDAGWRILGAGGGEEGETAKQVALRIKDDYRVIDDHTLVATLHALNISVDACGSFINWDPGRLPPGVIDTLEKPESCAPKGPVDCRNYDFEGERAPRYEQIVVTGDGRVSFMVTSPAFRETHTLQVHTDNNGALWHVYDVRPETEEQQLDPQTMRSLPVSLPEEEPVDLDLGTWLESVLPPRSMVVWPDREGPCDERPETAREIRSPQCADLRFSDDTGNSGTLYFTVNTDNIDMEDKPSFHSGVYKSGDSSQQIKSLGALRGILAN